jgi:glycosyltransferase involved in cell wall biosynthesis
MASISYESAVSPVSPPPAAVRRYRVLALSTHPVQYAAPLYRLLAKHPQLDFHVVYCIPSGAEGVHDPDFGMTVKWDIPLLDGYEWTELPNRGSGGESFFGMNNPCLWKFIREGRFDAVLCYTGYIRASFWIAYLAAKSSGAAFLFGTDATSLEARDGRGWKRMVKKIFWPFLFRLADQVLSFSSAGVDLMRSLGIPRERIALTHFVVDNDWWVERSARVDRKAMRNSWGATDGDRVVLFCAKLQPWKRPLDLLRAFAKAQMADGLLIFAGDGPLRPQLEAEAFALGVQDRVRFLGFANQSQLPAIYTAADLLVLPSEYEPFGLVVNEAMCCGCPVIASDRVGAARDLVTPVCPEWIFPCGDVEALAILLKDALADRVRLESRGRQSFERMRTWSPAENIAATVEAVEKSISRSRGTGRKSEEALMESAIRESGTVEKGNL